MKKTYPLNLIQKQQKFDLAFRFFNSCANFINTVLFPTFIQLLLMFDLNFVINSPLFFLSIQIKFHLSIGTLFHTVGRWGMEEIESLE